MVDPQSRGAPQGGRAGGARRAPGGRRRGAPPPPPPPPATATATATARWREGLLPAAGGREPQPRVGAEGGGCEEDEDGEGSGATPRPSGGVPTADHQPGVLQRRLPATGRPLAAVTDGTYPPPLAPAFADKACYKVHRPRRCGAPRLGLRLGTLLLLAEAGAARAQRQCRDGYKVETGRTDCKAWAREGQCGRNPEFMCSLSGCCKACRQVNNCRGAVSTCPNSCDQIEGQDTNFSPAVTPFRPNGPGRTPGQVRAGARGELTFARAVTAPMADRCAPPSRG